MELSLKNLKRISLSEFYVYFIFCSTFMALALSLLSGHLETWIAWTSLVAAVPASYFLSIRERPKLIPDFNYGLVMVVFGTLSYVFFQRYFYFANKAVWTSHANNFGDMPLHLHYLRYLTTAQFWPAHPGYPEDLLRYPFGMDLFNALFEKIGAPTTGHLFLTGFIGSLVLIHLLYRLGKVWGVLAFFCNGGLINVLAFTQGRLQDLQNAEAWKNLFLSVWITQRGFLWALPAGLLILEQWQSQLEEQKHSNRTMVKGALLLWGLAFFHLHSFFIFMIFGGIVWLLRKQDLKQLGTMIASLVLAFPFLWLSTHGFERGSVVHWHLSWTKEPNDNILVYWARNFGVFLLVVPWAFFTLRKNLRPSYYFALSALTLFLVFSNLMVAPWDWDNIKVLLWCYLILIFFIARYWIDLQKPFVQGALIFALFFSGAYGLWVNMPGRTGATNVFQLADINSLHQLLLTEPSSRIYLASPSHQHALLYLGKSVFMGYTGQLWSHGYNYQQKEEALKALYTKGNTNFRAPAGTSTLLENREKYRVIWGPMEQAEYHELSAGSLKLLGSSGNYQLYEIP